MKTIEDLKIKKLNGCKNTGHGNSLLSFWALSY